MTETQASGLAGGSSPLAGFDYRDVVDALHRAVIVTTVDGRIVSWNAAAERLYGWLEAEVLGRDVREVLVPPTAQEEAESILELVRRGESWQGDFSVLHRDGHALRVATVDRPIRDESGAIVAIVGVSEDITEQRLAALRTQQLADHLTLALEAGGMGTWRWDIASGETVWDAKLEELFGLAPGEFDGTFDAYTALLHPDDRTAVLDEVDRAVHDKRTYVVEHRVIWPDGSVHWLQGRGTVIVDDAGEVLGTMGCVADVTEPMRAAAELEGAMTAALHAADRERLAAQRLEFIGAVNDALAGSATRDEVMRNVTRVAVPTMGDFCGIYVLPTPESHVPDAEFAHVDDDVAEHMDRLRASPLFNRTSNTAVANVIRTGEPMFLPHIDEPVLESYDAEPEVRELARRFDFSSAIVVPLVKNRRPIGALQFVNSSTSRSYTLADLALAQAIASRVASTLENRRLAEVQRDIAMTLQASLLPNMLPEIPGVDLAVRYWAAGEGTAVGGDFYDAFAVDGDKVWAAVIGDVCGTGPAAAALTGLARHTIRASAWHGASPDAVLSTLNNAVLRCGQRTFCTALYCELVPGVRTVHLTVTAGGHPLPLLRRASGRCEAFGRPGTLLGLFESSRSTTVSTELVAGDVVVLYTDGVTDLPPPHALLPEQVCELTDRAVASAQSADEIAANLGRALEDALPFAERDDDIALLVMRVTDPRETALS